jgi:hypothetical protein
MSTFDETKNYKSLEFSSDRSQLWAQDVNLLEDLLAYKSEDGIRKAVGWNMQLTTAAGIPLSYTSSVGIIAKKIRPAVTLEHSGFYSFEVSGATCRYKYINGSWSAYAAVTIDGVTWNLNVAGSGFDIVFRNDGMPAALFGVYASEAVRSGGGNISYTGSVNQIRIDAGEWLVKGISLATPATVLSGVTDTQILYMSVATSTVDYTTDTTLAHYKGDGVFLPNPPTAEKLTIAFAVANWSSVPADATTWIIPLGYCSVTTGVVTVTPFFRDIASINDIFRAIDPLWPGDVPLPPTNLTVTFSGMHYSDLGVKALTGECNMVLACDRAPVSVSWIEYKVEWDATTTPLEEEFYLVKNDRLAVPAYTITGVQSGNAINVYARTIDALGRISAWATVVAAVTGGTCSIAQNPTFTLEKDAEGFWVKGITFASATVGLQGVSFFINEGSSPARTRKYLYAMIKFENGTSEVADFFVPWSGTNPYVITAPFDTKGVHYFSTVAPIGASIDLSASLIPGTDAGPTFTVYRMDGLAGVQMTVTARHANVNSIRIYAGATGTGVTPIATNFKGEMIIDQTGAPILTVLSAFGKHTDFVLVGVDRFGIPQTNYQTETLDLRPSNGAVFEVGKTSSPFHTIESAITAIHALALSKATIILNDGVYTPSVGFSLPAGFITNLTIEGVGKPTISGIFNWTNVAPHVSSAGEFPLSANTRYEKFGLVVRNCNILGTILKTNRTAGGSEQLGVAFIDCDMEFAHATSTTPFISSEQTSSGTDHYAVVVLDRCHAYDAETKLNWMYLTPHGAGLTADTMFVIKHCTIWAVDCGHVVQKTKDDKADGSAEFRIFYDNSIQLQGVAPYPYFVYECGGGSFMFTHNRVHCSLNVADANICNSGLALVEGTNIHDTSKAAVTNTFMPTPFLYATV